MDEKKLSDALSELGFRCVLGTAEYDHLGRPAEVVERREVNTHDYNNGVTVIYDEEGRPWITGAQTKETNAAIQTLVHERKLKRGAYVPHSNDGGRFINEMK